MIHWNQPTSRPEHALVVCCARTQADVQTKAQIQTLLEGPIDWDYLFNFARRHSVISLVYLQLSTTAPESVPSEHLGRLKEYYQQNIGRNLYLTGELGRILHVFAAEGIEAIPYKGPALAVSAYGNLNLRRFVDLDIMVRKADVLRAKELLIAQGYRCQTEWTRSQLSLLLHTQHNLSLRRENGRLIVELHWEVAPDLFAPSFQAEQLWERLVPIQLHNFVVKSLSAEDLFLSICVHGSKHLWTRLGWICDVAEMMKGAGGLDWDTLSKRARSTGTEKMLFLSLYLANCLFGAPFPDVLMPKSTRENDIAALAREVWCLLFSTEASAPTPRQSFAFNMRLRQSWRSRMRYCQLMLRPTDGDLSAVSLPRSLNFAYYIMRPFRLLLENREHRLVG